MTKPPKATIRRDKDQTWIKVTVKVNSNEIVGKITKRFPWTGKWLAPDFEWENVNGHEVTIKAALRFNLALSECIRVTMKEWAKLPESDKVKLR